MRNMRRQAALILSLLRMQERGTQYAYYLTCALWELAKHMQCDEDDYGGKLQTYTVKFMKKLDLFHYVDNS
jgi:hypothetical protein